MHCNIYSFLNIVQKPGEQFIPFNAKGFSTDDKIIKKKVFSVLTAFTSADMVVGGNKRTQTCHALYE